MFRPILFLALLLLSACAGGTEDTATDPVVAATQTEPIKVTSLLPDLRAASCSEGTPFLDGQPISIERAPVSLGGDEASVLTEIRFGGAWHLTSDEPNFGGLSGLAVLPDGELLAVSDGGAFVWIDMDADAPTGTGRIGYLRGDDGHLLSGKTKGDSEGLAVVDGVAFVSFERDHRVLAFDLEACGANARGALVSRISSTPLGFPKGFKSNQGAEALSTDGHGGLVVGLESGNAGASVSAISTLTESGLAFHERLARPNGPFLVGMDSEQDQTFALFRSYARGIGNLIEVRSYADLSEDGETRIRLARPYTVDNFEGIAATRLEDGVLRLYIISDDNFSDRQRTLLMAFDIADPGETPN